MPATWKRGRMSKVLVDGPKSQLAAVACWSLVTSCKKILAQEGCARGLRYRLQTSCPGTQTVTAIVIALANPLPSAIWIDSPLANQCPWV